MPNSIRRLAAIDLGTNSFHLVIADVKSNGKFTVVGKDKEVVRLGEGFNDMKHLSEEAMQRAIDTLHRFQLIAQSQNAPVRAIATSAVREALNQQEFIERVRRELGMEIEVVSGFEEARLIYLGVLQALPVYDRSMLLVDIGGGSTEFLVGRAGKVDYANSLKLGAVRLTQRFFSSPTLRPKDIAACREHLAGALNPIARAMRGRNIELAVGSSGTILNTAVMILASKGTLPPTEETNNLTITSRDLHTIVANVLEARSVERRGAIPGMDPARADIIVAGVLILEQIFEQLGLRSMVTSKYALREGILLDTLHKIAGEERSVAHLTDIRRASVVHLMEAGRVEQRHAHTVRRYAMHLFDQLREVHMLGNAEREYLEAASLLHDIGYHISHSEHHKHSYYLIRHSEMLGFTDREIEIIANIARYHRKSHPKLKHEGFPRLKDEDRRIVSVLAGILRVADGLDRRHQDVFSVLRCRLERATLHIDLTLRKDCDTSIELWGADRRKKLLEEALGISVRLDVLSSAAAA
ncbi:MAG TPA: Ppx/GppA phosphatase family protein [Bacteroidota bacterium]|nr:Ppx/GppA phosphatase family protein [Bacteroidota bacterium]